MGRTLHFDIKSVKNKFTDKELETIYNVATLYSNKCQWTCETFHLDPYAFYPNWNKFKTDNDADKAWGIVSARYKELETKGLHHNAIAKMLFDEKLVLFHNNENHPAYGFHGFCKTGGNELNSLQVVMGCLAVTRVVKNAQISLYDEGKLLKCGIIMQNGLAKPSNENKEQIAYLLSKALFDDNYKKYKDEFIAEAKALYEIQEKFSVFGNKEWNDISNFVRPINEKDFEEFPEYGAAQILAGFGGEYWNLTKEDPEAESYRMIAQIQKMFPKDCELQVAPKIKTF